MASMNCHYYSATLKSNISLNVVIPSPTGNEQIVDKSVQAQYGYESGLPVVYLLHGAYGDYSSWMRYSNVERYAQDRHCALVMASAGNNFYQDMYRGLAYRKFFTEELPAFVSSLKEAGRYVYCRVLHGRLWCLVSCAVGSKTVFQGSKHVWCVGYCRFLRAISGRNH